MVSNLGNRSYLEAVVATDDAFVYDVFCTTWESEVAALPNPNLARHVLRIQHIAQERRFAARYPHHERFVVRHEGRSVGRLYALETPDTLHLIDLTLMPEHRSHGLGTAIVRDLLGYARERGLTVSLQVPRQNLRATDLFASLGFALTDVDDLDNHFALTPIPAPEHATSLAGVHAVPDLEGPSAGKEGTGPTGLLGSVKEQSVHGHDRPLDRAMKE